MTIKDRTEVKEMLHDILSGYQALNESAIETTNNSLGKIENHLEKLNGRVAEHEKIININLPHNINLCPQRETIEALKENMISEEAIKKSVIVGVSIIVSLITIIWGVSEIFLK